MPEEKVRDIYEEMLDNNTSGLGSRKDAGWDAWERAQLWPAHILDGLTGETVDGKKCSLQNIDDMLNQEDVDLGPYSIDEWRLFFQRVRVEGI